MINKDQFEAICLEIETTHKGIKTILSEMHLDHTALNKYLLAKPEEKERYLLAKKNQVTDLMLETPEIEQDALEEIRNLSGEDIKKSIAISNIYRMKVDTRKFLAAKLVPKLFGDRLELQTDTVNRQVTVQILPPPTSQVNDQTNKINGLAA